MVWAPRPSAVVVKVAWPATRVMGAPRLVTPSLNCTDPVAMPAPGAVTATVAVKRHRLADG